MKKILLSMVVCLMTTIAFAQNDYPDVVYLKSGNIIRGIIIEQVPNESMKIEPPDGSLFVFKIGEIEKIGRYDYNVQQATNTEGVEKNGKQPENAITGILQENTTTNGEYATLYIYRLKKIFGALMDYDIHLGNAVICHAPNNWKTIIKVSTFGTNVIWAKTESKVEIPINLEPGGVYYIRCGVKMGLVVGRPVLKLVDKSIGEVEFSSIE